MTANAVIYEVRLRIDNEIIDAFDAWLAGHVEDMLQFNGFESAQTIDADSPEPDTSLRIVRYRISSRSQLQNYLDTHAAHMRAEGATRFGDRFSATRAIYAAETDTAFATEHHCRNCAAALRGQYCAKCGQRDKHRIISLWELLHDVVGDLFEVDSRVWRTLLPLLFKPGHLTNEYLRGRRVRYTPPFRLYLITSLIFFVVAFFGAKTAEFQVNGDDEDLAEVRREANASLEEAIAEVRREVDAARDIARQQPGVSPPPETPVELQPGAAPDSGDTGEPDAVDDDTDDRCTDIRLGDEQWQKSLTERARVVCYRLTEEGGARRFVGALIDNLPSMMFFFLPLIALVMKFLYPLARRYYVEHLLFFVHFHSFFFLATTISVLFSRLPDAIPGHAVAAGLLTAGLVFYSPIYLFVAMRRVYGQHFVVTAVKFAALTGAYLTSLLIIFALVVLFTALSL